MTALTEAPVRARVLSPLMEAMAVPPVRATTTDQGHLGLDARGVHMPNALVGSLSETGANRPPPETARSSSRPSLFDPTLYTLAQYLDDVEGLRKAQGNRRRILTTTEPDEDGEMRGFGLDESHPVVATIDAQIEQLDTIEHQTILALNRAMRKHPLAAWQKTQKGVGEKQLARLLAAIGDPYMRADNGQPRTEAQLWAYAGLHLRDDGNAAKRQKGVQSNWSTDAKTRAYLIATSCIKQDGDYRKVYDARRARTAITHEDWTPGHSHNDALRVVSKRILRDLWRAARNHHEGEQ